MTWTDREGCCAMVDILFFRVVSQCHRVQDCKAKSCSWTSCEFGQSLRGITLLHSVGRIIPFSLLPLPRA